MVLGDGVNRAGGREVRGDGLPGVSFVVTDKDIGLEVVPLAVIEGDIDDVFVIQRGKDIAHVCLRRDSGEG